MANQENFSTDIQAVSDSYTKFTVSRIIDNTQDTLLDMEVPAEFSDALLENNIEISLYSLADNSLIYSDVIRNGEGIFTIALQYRDNSLRRLLFIDFSKLELDLPTGQYTVSLNFFADELGSSDERVLNITNISTSRTEVEMELTDVTLQPDMEQFAIPRIPVNFIYPVLAQIFNQSGSDAVDVPTSPIKIDSSSLYRNFTSESGERLIEYQFDVDAESKLGINTITQNVLDDAYPLVIEKIEAMILNSGSTSFTETELEQYVIESLDIAYDSALDDEAQNPQHYRFDLI
jgi:hypothetical protein